MAGGGFSDHHSVNTRCICSIPQACLCGWRSSTDRATYCIRCCECVMEEFPQIDSPLSTTKVLEIVSVGYSFAFIRNVWHGQIPSSTVEKVLTRLLSMNRTQTRLGCESFHWTVASKARKEMVLSFPLSIFRVV